MIEPRRRRFRFWSRTRDEVRRGIRDEFDFHVDMRTDELVRGGLEREAARARALREFGDQRAGAGACAALDDRADRKRRLAQVAGELIQDARLGLRLLARSPGFAVVAILTLALGIGGTSAIYGALDAVLLRPLPYPAPDRLVQVFEVQDQGLPNSVSGGAFLDWRRHQRQFASLTLLNRVTQNLRTPGQAERVTGLQVTHEFLDVFGIRPMLGRGFRSEDDRLGGRNDVVILTEELWRTRLGGLPSIVGDTIVLDEVRRTVIGVVPNGAWIFGDQQFFIPAVLDPATPRGRRSPHWAVVFGRLAPGATAWQADGDLKGVKARLAAEYPRFKQSWSVAVRPLQSQLAQDSRSFLLILIGAVAMVLLIACANVANLLLARASHRDQEIALRRALGATPGRIVRQVLTESVVLAVAGGAAGILLSYWTIGVLQTLIADIVPRAMTPRLDARVLAASVLITSLTGLLFGALPALRARRTDVNDTLKNGGRSITAGRRHRTQSALVVVEVALTVVLLAAAGMLLRSLANVSSIDPGFDPERVLAIDLSLPAATYGTTEHRLAFSRNLLARVRALPGVEEAGTSMAVPFAGGGSGEYFWRSDRPPEPVLGRIDFVSEGYLEALGTRLVAGRRLTEADNRSNGPRIAVINDTAARLFFPGGDAVGQRVSIATNPYEVVGVIATVVERRLDAAARPNAYVPQAFDPSRFSLVVRAHADPNRLIEPIRREMARLDPGVPLDNVRALDTAMAASLRERRLVLDLIGAFAVAALVLACIGLYGVLAYAVATRRRELSIRMALGAVRRDVIAGVFQDGFRLVVAGLVLGLAGAVGATRLLGAQLYQVRSDDPVAIGGAVAALATVALVACWIPAWRATRLDPIAALRND